MFARDFGQKPRRYRVSFPVALLGQPVQIIAPAWIAGRHAYRPQQFFDRIAMGLLLPLQQLPLAANVVRLDVRFGIVLDAQPETRLARGQTPLPSLSEHWLRFLESGLIYKLSSRGCASNHSTEVGTMAIMRLSKVAMIAALAAYALIVAYDNIVDYGSNYDFVKHVLSMDTTFPSNALRQRAISDASIWRLAYELIIGIEWLTGVLLTVGALVLLRRLGASAQAFNRAKVWAIAGLTVGFGLWFFGFMVIAGEYFAMWQSNVWNGQEAAFRIATEVLGVLVFVSLPDGDLA